MTLGSSLYSRDLYVDTETGVIYNQSEKRDVSEARSLTAIENFIGGLFNKRDELDARSLTAIGNFFSNLFGKRDLDARSLTAIGNFFSSIFGYVSIILSIPPAWLTPFAAAATSTLTRRLASSTMSRRSVT